MTDRRADLTRAVTDVTAAYFRGEAKLKDVFAARNALAEYESEAVRPAPEPFLPPKRPKPKLPPAPTPTEIHAELQRRAPDPPRIHLLPSEQLALAAYRADRERARKKRDAQWDRDPMFQTWMP